MFRLHSFCLLVFVFLTLSVERPLYAQKSNWNNREIFTMGYRYHTYTMDPYIVRQTGTGSDFSFEGAGNGSIAVHTSGLVYEQLKKGWYTYTDASWASTDLMARWFVKGWRNRKKMRAIEIPLIRLGLGGWFSESVAIYVGGQYTFSYLRGHILDEPNVVQGFIGGNHYGLGLHGFYATEKLMFKYSGMYDWLQNSGSAFQGFALTNELTAYFDADWDGVGLFARGQIRFRSLEQQDFENGTLSEPSWYTSYKSNMTAWPKTTATDMYVGMGIMF